MLTLAPHLANSQELLNFLKWKLLGEEYHQPSIIPNLNIYDFDPWDLPQVSWINSNERERYYFSPLGAKSPGSSSRLTTTGSWQAKGPEKPIVDELTGQKLGTMRIYVHSHKENGVKWVMHEFKATLNLPNQETLVLCKIMKKPDKTPQRTGKKPNRPYKKTKIATCDEGELSFNTYKKTGLSTNNNDQKTDNNTTYDEGETSCFTNIVAENYVADVTIEEGVYHDPVQYQQSFLCYNQHDYSDNALQSPMLAGQGFPCNGFDTSDEFDDPFNELPLWT